MNWMVAVAAVVAALDVPQRTRLLRAAPAAQRAVVGGGFVAVAVVFAFVATPLLDLLDISSPTMEVGAGLVLALWSAVALVRWDDEPAPEAVAGGLVPLLFPIVLTPVVGVTVVAVAARNGWWLPVLAAAVAAVPIAVDAAGRPLARRHWRVLSAAIGSVVGVVMVVDGALAV
jgi:small neutral amino acid transporter SnatA (MarC family)